MATGISKTKWNGNGGSAPAQSAKLDVFLHYEGKKDESEILSAEKAQIVTLFEPKDPTENGLYFGDNLRVLASLLPRLRGKVKLVYIDPPYATRMVFQSRNQANAYGDLLVGAHYIEFLRERLVLLREMLSQDGSIYVHLDDNMAFHIKIMMDEVFGPQNFRNWITRKKCNPKNYTRKAFGNVADFILFYSKSAEYVWNRPLEDWTPERVAKEYEYVDAATGRLFKKVPVHAPGVRNGATGGTWRGLSPPPGKHWQYVPEKLEEMDANGEIYWSANGNPRRKVFFESSKGVPYQDIWMDCRDAHNQNIRVTGYPTEKNPDVINRIICASSNPGDLVLDAFVGSGTTLEVAANNGRNWVGIDNSAEAILTTLKRLMHGTKAMGDFVSARAKSEGQQQAIEFNDERPSSCDEDRQMPTESPVGRITNFSVLAEDPVPADVVEAVRKWRQGEIRHS
jgi:adenine-specific DNA-methyltransferase